MINFFSYRCSDRASEVDDDDRLPTNAVANNNCLKKCIVVSAVVYRRGASASEIRYSKKLITSAY